MARAQHGRVLAGFVTLALGYVAAAAKDGDLLAGGNFIRRGAAGGETMFLASAVAGVATDVLLEVRVAFDVTGGFGVAGLAELMDGLGAGHGYEEEEEPLHA